MISFKNGVIYGTGNILGYDRVDKNHFVVNKEQAETVKRIYELYLDGNGVRRIQDIMEQEGRKTATGLTRWSSSNISRILTAFINMEAFDPRAKIPDRIIDGFVERIIYDKGEFIWYLNPQVGNAIFEVDTTDWKKKMFKANKMVYPSLSGTGSYR